MNKNLLAIGGIVVVILVGGAGFMMRNNQPTTTPAPTPTVATIEEPIVELSDSGFSPATVTVKQGQKVKFVNSSAGKMSVASNPHPTHTIYPEFDQYKTSQRGMAQFEFTFEKVGTWGYHNHANPSQTGTIIVTN